jgi:hypothetical protein
VQVEVICISTNLKGMLTPWLQEIKIYRRYASGAKNANEIKSINLAAKNSIFMASCAEEP